MKRYKVFLMYWFLKLPAPPPKSKQLTGKTHPTVRAKLNGYGYLLVYFSYDLDYLFIHLFLTDAFYFVYVGSFRFCFF